jgi:hypothetical protein
MYAYHMITYGFLDLRKHLIYKNSTKNELNQLEGGCMVHRKGKLNQGMINYSLGVENEQQLKKVT